MAEWGDEWGELWGGAIALIQTHEDDAVDRLKFHLNGKVNAESVVQIFAERWQIIDNFLSDLLTLIDLDNSFGDLQDKLGKILNVDRAGFLDEDYARFLNAKALVLIRKRKTLPGLLELARALMGPKSLASLEPFIFDPDMSTLIDRVTAEIGVPIGTTYDADDDARTFDGVVDRVDFEDIPAVAIGATFSAECRVSLPLPAGGRLITWDGALGNSAFRLTVNIAGTVQVLWQHVTTDLVRQTTATVPDDGRFHLVTAVVPDSIAANTIIYIDGVAQTSYSVSTDGVGAPFVLGGSAAGRSLTIGGRDTGGINFTGEIRNVLGWDRVLSGAEVLTLFQGGKRFIGFKETFPKAFQLTLEGITTEEEIVFREFLRTARPATYNGTVLVVPDPAFGYDDSTAAVSTDVEGFDNASAPLTFGGPYAHLFVL